MNAGEDLGNAYAGKLWENRLYMSEAEAVEPAGFPFMSENVPELRVLVGYRQQGPKLREIVFRS